VCSANTAVHSAQRLTCEFSLYFQTVSYYHLCKRELLLHYQTPTLQRQKSLWIYHFPMPHQVTLHCPTSADPTPRSEVLSDAGLPYNALTCHIYTSDVQIFPELRGTTQMELHAPKVYLPNKVTIMADYKMQQMNELSPTEIQRLDDVNPMLRRPNKQWTLTYFRTYTMLPKSKNKTGAQSLLFPYL